MTQTFILTILLLTILNPFLSSQIHTNSFFGLFSSKELLFIPNTAIQMQLSSDNIDYLTKTKLLNDIDEIILAHSEVASIGTSSNSVVLLPDGNSTMIHYYNKDLLSTYRIFIENTNSAENITPIAVITSSPKTFHETEFLDLQLYYEFIKEDKPYHIISVLNSSTIQMIDLASYSGTTPTLSDIFHPITIFRY